jgi:hypothetical protein
MYSTCLFCKSGLGGNESVEHFPIGRRLAFDAAKGRLWVVCRKCERWNLTPLEERWEAIEECERAYRSTKLRASTDQIGLARISEGLELVRIGQPLRPEFAAWRYGDQFGKRRRRTIIRGTAVSVAVIAVPFLGPSIGISIGGAVGGAHHLVSLGSAVYRRRKVAARIPIASGTRLTVRVAEVGATAMISARGDKPWALRVKHQKQSAEWWRYIADDDETDLRGDDALRAAAQLLPRLNSGGAKGAIVSEAVKLASASADSRKTFDDTARRAASRRSWNDYGKGAILSLMPPEIRLALEMASHEDTERRALDGELYLLEEAWREAEEIARISDNLFLPAAISNKLEEMKAQRPS